MWLVAFLNFTTRFGFGFHCFHSFFIVIYVFSGYITIEILIQCMCFALNLNKMFYISYFFGKFIIYKKNIIGYKEPTTIVAPSTACLLLSRGGCHILLIFYFTLVANFASIWFILTWFICSQYLINPNAPCLGSQPLLRS